MAWKNTFVLNVASIDLGVSESGKIGFTARWTADDGRLYHCWAVALGRAKTIGDMVDRSTSHKFSITPSKPFLR